MTSASSFANSPQPTSAAPDGAEIYAQHCAKCHGDEGQGISAVNSIAGPCIQAVHNSGEALAAVEVGPSHMPSFVRVLSIEEMRAVADYVTQHLATIPLPKGDLREGGQLFRQHCAGCHRTAARGGALAYTGTNAPALTGKSAAMIAGAIRFGPGPMPAFPRSVIPDQQLASIVQYVEFIQDPPTPGGNPLFFYGPVPEGLTAWVAILALIAATVWIEKGRSG